MTRAWDYDPAYVMATHLAREPGGEGLNSDRIASEGERAWEGKTREQDHDMFVRMFGKRATIDTKYHDPERIEAIIEEWGPAFRALDATDARAHAIREAKGV